MDEYISISNLNDYVFCPYSIYLHNIYMNVDEGLYQATPQTRGNIVHKSIDEKNYNKGNCLTSLNVCSNEYKLIGKIDIYDKSEKVIIERKYSLKNIYKGQIYQLWAQYLCMKEMGYDVEELAFYEVKTKRKQLIPLPSCEDIKELKYFLTSYRQYNPSNEIITNINKCRHCIYCNLCDKTTVDNVYE